jgi:hypothetical protein
MKTFMYSFVAIAICLHTGGARAEGSAEKLELESRSKAVGFAKARLPVLVRRAGNGTQKVADEILAALPQLSGRAGLKVTADDGALHFESSDWRLRVSDGGNNIRFRSTSAEVPSFDPSSKPSLAAIEATGRAFIAQALAGVVKVGEDDELVFLGTQYSYETEQAMNSDVPGPSRLTGWIVNFGRKIAGEVVLGGGSAVSLFYQADGSLEGFDVDWPAYDRTGTDLETVSADVVRERMSKARAATRPGETREQRMFMCGLYDRGGRSKRGRSSMVQPGCLEAVAGSNADGEAWGIVTTIPGAKVPVTDPTWAGAAKFCSSAGSACRALPR